MESNGTLRAIYVAAEEGGPIESVRSGNLRDGLGIEGDRYADNAQGGVTVFRREDFLAAVESAGLEEKAQDGCTRRNLEIEGLDAVSLRAPFLRIGSVVLKFVQDAQPCGIMENSVGPGAKKALQDRAGIRCTVLRGGRIQVGDTVTATHHQPE